MGDQSIQKLERLSALVDGQLSEDEFSQALADLEASPESRAQWDTYHLLGDVMRSGVGKVRQHDAEFVSRLRQKLPTIAIKNVAVEIENTRAEVKIDPKKISANDSSWRMVVGFASVALISVLTWQGMHWTGVSDSAAVQQLAQQGVSVSPPLASSIQLVGDESAGSSKVLVRRDGTSALAMASDESQVMIRDPHLDALLAAHRQYGGASALQMPSGFLRNATFAEGGR